MRNKDDMKIFTIFGLAIFLFGVMVILSVLLNAIFFKTDEMIDGIGFMFVIFVLSIIISLFLTQPENFGYEKIVSNNSVEQEVEK